MSHRSKVILTSIFVLFDIVLLVCIVNIRNATMENHLKKEMGELITLDFTKDIIIAFEYFIYLFFIS